MARLGLATIPFVRVNRWAGPARYRDEEFKTLIDWYNCCGAVIKCAYPHSTLLLGSGPDGQSNNYASSDGWRNLSLFFVDADRFLERLRAVFSSVRNVENSTNQQRYIFGAAN